MNLSERKLNISTESYGSIEKDGVLIIWPISDHTSTVQCFIDLARENSIKEIQ